MDRTRITVSALIGVMFITSCDIATKEPSVKEAVLARDQSIEAVNKNGKVTISYISSIKRKYEWDGSVKIVKMIPRDERFQDKLGLYQPADSWGLNPFEVRIVAEEAIIDFKSEDAMYAFLSQSDDYLDWKYTADGVVVGFGRMPSRKQLNIDLYQFLVGGKKPIEIKGARPDAIRINPK
jgi:hypothetical protein